ncbi:hypothetical protein GF339_15775 [candidate division KSB3 bacterium]|uniref:DUF3996 domain-containing protein n=1 Tax=candidate division KSB3 bacterium TaxID=2044937 RepID=A0A9D5JXM7_9BACT|nr:hypothetical protein [candidate division KSB3 bacterium]MBD3326044.1 hypothetical protein [candidate division KSB3 bacterium]
MGVVIGLAQPALSQQQGMGLGVILGEPTGLSLKNWLSSTTALDAAAAWSFGDYESFQFHADYLWHHRGVIEPQLPVYYGVGGRIKLKEDDPGRGEEEDTRVGIRFPFGITYLFPNAPFDLFFEIAPILDVAPATDVQVNAAVGGRFYLGR